MLGQIVTCPHCRGSFPLAQGQTVGVTDLELRLMRLINVGRKTACKIKATCDLAPNPHAALLHEVETGEHLQRADDEGYRQWRLAWKRKQWPDEE